MTKRCSLAALLVLGLLAGRVAAQPHVTSAPTSAVPSTPASDGTVMPAVDEAHAAPPASPAGTGGSMTCTCAEPVRSGAVMALAGILVTILSLSASAAFSAAALYLFKKSRLIRSS